MKILNLYYKDTPNIGDRSSAPASYFPLLAEEMQANGPIPRDSAVIIGGGGLLHPGLEPTLRRILATRPRRSVLWGIGTNVPRPGAVPWYPDWIARCDLVGLRDYPNPFRWVPCASCMSPLFDWDFPPEHEVVIYRHGDRFGLIPPTSAPTLTNFCRNLEEVIRFLGSGEYVVTDTYHGAYWATLLGRKVIVYPSSTRHRYTRYVYPLLERGDPWTKGRASACTYPEALEECRAANRGFYRDVSKLLETA